MKRIYLTRGQIRQVIQTLSDENPSRSLGIQCGAKTRQGKPCKNSPLIGGAGQRCKYHGGMSLSGTRHPNWKHGRCTKAQRAMNKVNTAQIKLLEVLAIQLGMLVK